jgi:hypothetical protein
MVFIVRTRSSAQQRKLSVILSVSLSVCLLSLSICRSVCLSVGLNLRMFSIMLYSIVLHLILCRASEDIVIDS